MAEIGIVEIIGMAGALGIIEYNVCSSILLTNTSTGF